LQTQGLRFVINTKSGEFEKIELNGAKIDATEITDLNTARNLLEKIKNIKLNTVDGIYARITIAFNDEVLKGFEKAGTDIAKEYSVTPIVNFGTEYKNLTKYEAVINSAEDVKKAVKNDKVTALNITNEAIFNLQLKDELLQIDKTQIQRYLKGLQAVLNSKFDYTVKDIMALKEILTIDFTNKSKEEIESMFSETVFNELSSDSQTYIKYLLSKGEYVEALGAVRAVAMNAVRNEIIEVNKVNIDIEKLKKNDKFHQAFLTLALQLKLQGQDISKLITDDTKEFIEMNAEEYLSSITAQINGSIENILSNNEYAIKEIKAEQVKTAIDTLQNFNILFRERFTKREIPKQIKISIQATRSVLAAA
jgi:hypothetical protein